LTQYHIENLYLWGDLVMRTYQKNDTACIVVQTQSTQLINVRQQAALLSVSPRHLHDLTKQRIVPCVRLGRAVRYNPQAVAAALERNATQKALA
jgi:predicted DNA-binding transcriptional regulator AlpA